MVCNRCSLSSTERESIDIIISRKIFCISISRKIYIWSRRILSILESIWKEIWFNIVVIYRRNYKIGIATIIIYISSKSYILSNFLNSKRGSNSIGRWWWWISSRKSKRNNIKPVSVGIKNLNFSQSHSIKTTKKSWCISRIIFICVRKRIFISMFARFTCT